MCCQEYKAPESITCSSGVTEDYERKEDPTSPSKETRIAPAPSFLFYLSIYIPVYTPINPCFNCNCRDAFDGYSSLCRNSGCM